MKRYTGIVTRNENHPYDHKDYFYTDPNDEGQIVPCSVHTGPLGTPASDLSKYHNHKLSLEGEADGHWNIWDATGLRDEGAIPNNEIITIGETLLPTAPHLETRQLSLYVNSKIPMGTYNPHGPNGGRYESSGVVPIPDGADYYDHSTAVTTASPADDPSQYGHEVHFQRRAGDQKIIGVVLFIWCENNPIFGAGRWNGVTLSVQVRFLNARAVRDAEVEVVPAPNRISDEAG